MKRRITYLESGWSQCFDDQSKRSKVVSPKTSAAEAGKGRTLESGTDTHENFAPIVNVEYHNDSGLC